MTIDLRYILPFAAFYVPSAMLTFGVWLLGFQWHEARDFVAIFGVIFGAFASAVAVAWAFNSEPVLVRIGGKGGAE